MKRLGIICLFLLTPLSAAAVQISEIAWMGTEESANHEWIELYNSGTAVDVTGWQITDRNNLQIDLMGTIGAGQYVVLERTSDASAPGTAFLLYTGALGNAGATLYLRDAAGSIVSQVTGGENWETIGGNNETKETAQVTSAGWITAIATPGSAPTGVTANVPVGESVSAAIDSSESENTRINTSSGSSKEKIVLELKDSTLQLQIDAPSFAYVNQPVDMSVTPSGTGDALMASVQYEWNFGDGTTTAGQDVTHAFANPGRYVVVVDGQYKRQQQVSRTEIEVLPVRVALTASAGEVAVINTGTTEVDLSSYRLVGREEFIIPKHTILLPGRTLALDEQVLGGDADNSMVVLYDQESAEVATLLPLATRQRLLAQETLVSETVIDETEELPDVPVTVDAPLLSSQLNSEVAPLVQVTPAVPVTPVTPVRNPLFTFASETQSEPTAAPSPFAAAAMAADTVTATSQVAAFTNTAKELPARWPLYTLIGLLVLGVISVYLIPSHGRGDNRV